MSSHILREQAQSLAQERGTDANTLQASYAALTAQWGDTFTTLPLVQQFAVILDFTAYWRAERTDRTIGDYAREYVTRIGHLNCRSYAKCALINLHDAAGIGGEPRKQR